VSAESDAAEVAALFAVDPAAMGGVCLRSGVQPARDRWLELLRELLPADAPLRRVPFNVPDGRLLGGLDLVATLKANRPIAERGVLADAHGGIVILTMAERLSAATAAKLCAVLDSGEVSMPREGVMLGNAARIGVVALDESMDADERVPAALLDRLAFLLDFTGFSLRTLFVPAHEPEDILAARALLPAVTLDPALVQALCATALALGAGSARVCVLALAVARAAAALDGRRRITEADAALAGRLVLAPRATQLPAPAPDAEPPPAAERPSDADPPPPPRQEPAEDAGNPPPPPPDPGPEAADPLPQEAPSRSGEDSRAAESKPLEIDQQGLEDLLLQAVRASMPAGLLARLRGAAPPRAGRPSSAGRTGAQRSAAARGRPAGVRSGAPQGSARLNVIETLRAAAPWQALRGRTSAGDTRIRVGPDDFRVTRYKQRAPTLTIFAVDASGSSALNRLAEAKGAVELLLADCYVRRDQVAVIAFRGRRAELLLPPTRSLVRAKRSLAGLPGGGGTPLAAALDAALDLARLAQRRGETPTVVLLTDGRANVARQGEPGRELAHAQALTAAQALGRAGVRSLFVDTSPRPNELARQLAAAMRAEYIPLPLANARALSAVVTAAAGPRSR
jgi:magnesium chelatase subunit D